jgi:hypothetical protein
MELRNEASLKPIGNADMAGVGDKEAFEVGLSTDVLAIGSGSKAGPLP